MQTSQALCRAAASRGFDCVMAYHCAPVMAGLKPANMISIRREDWLSIARGLTRSAGALAQKQIFFKRLAQCQNRVLMLVYRRDLLAAHVSMPDNAAILARYGYTPDMPLPAMLTRLAGHIAHSGAFPHEIGVFLGYPPQDVRGFIENNGQNYCLRGCWKVYADPAQAQQLFSSFDQARGCYCARVLEGAQVCELAVS